MAGIVITPEIAARIEEARREQVARLARKGAHLEVARDTIAPGWVVRNPRIPATIELVTDRGECTCRRYRTWGRCVHAARVEELYGIAG